MSVPIMRLSASVRRPFCAAVPRELGPNNVKGKIDAFLRGESHGGELLHTLYDHVLEEPIPERLRALVRGS